MLGAVFLVILASVIGGIFVGALLSFFLGAGDREEDTYDYKQSMIHGRTLLLITVEQIHYSRAKEILDQAQTAYTRTVISQTG
jgi:hypothetical protein